ncbi:MAG TPA: NUDIX domain-containing protein [Candidatus Saccharimonadales bacterium]|nr:NUDIX domain-containing protein [Candidatus Saccharimonadales bacterium]
MNQTTVFSGKIGEVIHEQQPDGRTFERFRRPPGTRLVIVSPDNKILITKEHRQETGNVDLRLPGGKVRDSLAEYHALLQSGQSMLDAAKEAAAKEAAEETGHIVKDLRFLTCATAGATVEWDLYYFLVRDYSEHPDGQQLEHGEDITITWLTPAQLRQAIADGHMQEWRSVGVLLGLVLPGLESKK